ncbi:MAG: PAS domain-containing protein [Candidatus Heimdallarchaeaceae archaeon]
MLEKKEFEGPSQVMWAKHDEVRQLIRQGSEVDAEEFATQVEDMIFKEETILFPTSLELLSIQDWQNVKNGEEEIGFAWVSPGDEWKPVTPEVIHEVEEPPQLADILSMQTGKLTLEQINLIMTNLPIEISFINENEEVAYYSDTKERIFPRSPGVIGRKVQRCHPPKSLDKVMKIIEAFKTGQKDVAEFWLNMNGKYIHIRYFAIRDNSGKYRGTLEVMQDVTSIRALEGERRLINWGEDAK